MCELLVPLPLLPSLVQVHLSLSQADKKFGQSMKKREEGRQFLSLLHSPPSILRNKMDKPIIIRMHSESNTLYVCKINIAGTMTEVIITYNNNNVVCVFAI